MRDNKPTDDNEHEDCGMTELAEYVPNTLGVNDLGDMCQNNHPGQPSAKAFDCAVSIHSSRQLMSGFSDSSAGSFHFDGGIRLRSHLNYSTSFFQAPWSSLTKNSKLGNSRQYQHCGA